MEGCSPLGSGLLLVSRNLSPSSPRPRLLKAAPSHLYQVSAAAARSRDTAPRSLEATRNHLDTGTITSTALPGPHLCCCQSHTMSKSPMPAQAGGEGLLPTVSTWPRLLQLRPVSSLHTAHARGHVPGVRLCLVTQRDGLVHLVAQGEVSQGPNLDM